MITDFRIPSPEQSVVLDWTNKVQISLSIKRDDLIHPIISGNKWRKLKGHLQVGISNDYDTICTFGGAYSNHLVAVAAAGAILHKKTIGFVRSFNPSIQNPLLSLCKMFGMRIEMTHPNEYNQKKHKVGLQNQQLFIPEGGAGKDGINGVKDIITELQHQYNHIIVACGTGTTVAGLTIASEHLPTQIHGIQVLKGEHYILQEIKEKYGVINTIIHENYHFGGYAKTNGELLEFMQDFTAQTGILLDPIYTGKMMYAIRDLAEKRTFKPNDKILAIHTGGLTGWLGKMGIKI
jgi:1-aminocyclopropane-1-carboxylate deaminase